MTPASSKPDLGTPPPSDSGCAVVAGASGAIGSAVARALAVAGWSVIATYRTRSPKPIEGVRWVPFDGCIDQRSGDLAQALAAEQRPLRAVISCIGAPSAKQSIAATPGAEFDAVFSANVTATVRLWQTLHARARLDRAGVVFLSSDATATLKAGNGPYSAAKAGLEALAVTLAAEELQHGVRVNVLAPSLVASPLAQTILARKGVTDVEQYYQQLPFGRALTTEEVAVIAVEIATAPHWRYATGQTVRLAVHP